MTESSETSHVREIVAFQLCLLELYEALLDICVWDEAKINTALKTFMASVLGLLRVQRSLGAQVVTVQKEAIREHRARLERWLAAHGEPAGDGASRNGFPWARPDEHVPGGRER